jgi:hypothetical protein
MEVSYIASNNNEAEKFHGTLDFRNVSAAACIAYGFPSEWFEDNGNDVGPQSTDVTTPPAAFVTLQPDEWMTALITITDTDLIDGCTIVQMTDLDVRPAGVDNHTGVPIPQADACSNGVALISVGALVFE